MERAYYLTKQDLTDNLEINFLELSKNTNNFIISYHYNDITYFRRALFELDRINSNIGILIELDSNCKDIDAIEKDFINSIKGFNINLGVWIDYKDDLSLALYNKLNDTYDNNFVTGMRYFGNKLSNYSPIWEYNGDISESNISTISSESKKKYKQVFLINDYKTIYNENNLKPIPSNYNS